MIIRLTNKTRRRIRKISPAQYKTFRQQQMMKCFSAERWEKSVRKAYSEGKSRVLTE